MPTSSVFTVNWSHAVPPLPPHHWHAWDAASMGIAADADATTEKILALPHGTLATLRTAFALKLSRHTGFAGSNDLQQSDRQRLQAAAQLYKRGVGYRDNLEKTNAGSPVMQSGSYTINITSSVVVKDLLFTPQAFTILDGNVARSWPHILEQVTNPLIQTLTEHSKTLDSVATILQAWQNIPPPKPHSWQIVGGGLLADVAMLAAAVVRADAVLIPTTLLAMADACIGGKTGVNFSPYGKNQLGAFYFPKAVHIWTGWLKTLPPRELAAGAAECLKHAFLAGNMQLADAFANAIASADLMRLSELMPQIINYKANVVACDPAETGERAILNFGHTLAHALEMISHANTKGSLTLLHGEAVAIGLAFALNLSVKVAGLSFDDAQLMKNYLVRAGCTTSAELLAQRLGVAALNTATLLESLKKSIALDKKNSGKDDYSDWILLKAPGQIARQSADSWTISVAWDVIADLWQTFKP